MGWDWFEDIEESVEEARRAQQKTAEDLQRAFHATFSTPAGQVVLQHMRDFMNRQKRFDPDRGFYDGAAMGFYRDGQDSMVAYTEEMVKRGSKL